MKGKKCCFLGHLKFDEKSGFRDKFLELIEGLIEFEGVDEFLFFGDGAFDDVCLRVVTFLKYKYPRIKRLLVKLGDVAEDEWHLRQIKKKYDGVFPLPVSIDYNEGYVRRRYSVIDKSDICVFYYDKKYVEDRKKRYAKKGIDWQSGTQDAYEYADSQGKTIINTAEF